MTAVELVTAINDELVAVFGTNSSRGLGWLDCASGIAKVVNCGLANHGVE